MPALLCLHKHDQHYKLIKPCARAAGAPETWTTCGTYLRPSIVVMSVTLAHAILCGSRATRMMHRFVFGEKYLTIRVVNEISKRR